MPINVWADIMYITIIYEKCGEGAFIRGEAFIRDNTVYIHYTQGLTKIGRYVNDQERKVFNAMLIQRKKQYGSVCKEEFRFH